jgi:hypothetical protein
MFRFLKADPIKKLQKQYESLMEKAMHAQRNGKIEEYGKLSLDAEKVLKELEKLKSG